MMDDYRQIPSDAKRIKPISGFYVRKALYNIAPKRNLLNNALAYLM